MHCRSFIVTVVLSCIALSAACDGGSQEAVSSGTTEVNLLISDPATAPEELALLIDFVSYRITCLDSAATPTYDDSVDIIGNFETNVTENPAVWTLVTDLPLSPCSIALWVFYEDEVVCSGSETLSIVEDDNVLAPNKANIVLECNLSVNGPSGDVGVDGSFEFIHGNYCPKLIWLGATPSATSNEPLSFDIKTSSFDRDSTCGLNCDPQTCDFSQNPPVCTAAPDPGFSTTLSAPAGKGSFATASATGTPLPDDAGTPIEFATTFECDPLFPGPTEICDAAHDGDDDCTQIRCITIVCPDLCAGDPCHDGRECTRDRCNPLDGSCTNDPAPPGIACNDCKNTCQSNGVCNGPAWTAVDEFTGVTTFSGTVQPYSATLVNPYSGASFSVSGTFRLNDSSYKGLGAVGEIDTLLGTNQGDVLLVQDPPGTQRICGVEEVLAQNSFDVMFLADDFIVLDDMVIVGGRADDLLAGNAGDDHLIGGNGDDHLDGGPGNDTIEGGLGNDTITLWPGSGFDSIDGGMAAGDRVEIDAEQNQIRIDPGASPYEFNIFYLGTLMAQITGVEFLVLNDALIDLTTCTGGMDDVCNLCGNDDLNGDEGCDDGNNVDGDGCAADCKAEY
jgi:cysteine-rich repeat protein